MKKFILLIFLLLVLPTSILAAGSISPSKNSIDIIIGNTSSVTITASNAVGRADFTVGDGNVASVDTTSYWFDNDTLSLKISGKAIGSTKIYMTLVDAATMDEEELTGVYTINVNVIPVPDTPKTPDTPVVPERNNKSNNNRLGSISISGLEPSKIDNNNYLLIVNNNVTNVDLQVTAEDSKAKVIGNGNKTLNIGENNFEVIITAENGSQNRINVNVVRKDGRYLKELSTALVEEEKDVSIILLENDIITKDDLELVKSSGKIVTFNYYNTNKKLLYSWIIDGKKLSTLKDVNTKISFDTENRKDIYKASNYADGKYISFAHDGKIASGVSIKVNVSDTFENDDMVYVYNYDSKNKKLQNYKDGIKVKDGFIEYDVSYGSEYFVTMSNVNKMEYSYTHSSKMVVLSIVEGAIILGLGYAFYTLYIGKKH